MNRLNFILLPFCILFYSSSFSQSPGCQDIFILQSLLKKGEQFQQQRQFDSAVIHLKLGISYLTFRSSLQTKIGLEFQLQLANTFLSDGQIDSAQKYIEQLDITTKRSSIKSDLNPLVNYIKGRIHYTYARADSADYYYKKSFKECEQTNQDSLRVLITKDLGNVQFINNEYNNALALYRRALGMELERQHPSDLLLSSLYQNISIIHSKNFEYEKADHYFKKSLSMKEKILPKDDLLLIKAYLNYSVFLTQIGKFENAILYSQNCQNLIISKYGFSYYLLAHIYYNNSLIYELLEEDYKAKYYIEKALYHFQNHFSNSQIRLDKITYNLAFALYRIDKVPNAIKELGKIIKNDPIPAIRILALDLLARCYSQQGKNFQTDSCYKEAIETAYNNNLESKLKIPFLLSDYGYHLFKNGSYDSAIIYLEKALYTSCNEYESDVTRFSIKDRLAKCYNAQNNYGKSISIYLEQIEDLRSENQISIDSQNIGNANPDIIKILIQSYIGYGITMLDKFIHANADTNDLKKATQGFDTAKILLKHYDTKNSNINFFIEKDDITSDMLFYEFQANYMLYCILDNDRQKQKLFKIIEDSKASSLKLSLNSVNALHFSDIPDSLINWEKQLKNRIDYYNNRIKYLDFNGSGTDSILLNEYKDKRFHAQGSYDSLYIFFKSKFHKYYNLKHDVLKTDISKIQKDIPNDACMINYWLDQGDIFFATITKNQLRIVRQNIGPSFIKRLMQYHTLIKKGGNKQEIIELSTELYSYLIAPIEEIIQGKKKLIIIPDGYLYYVPFESLCRPTDQELSSTMFSEQHYLVQDYSISYHYSTSLWYRSLKSSQSDTLSLNQGGFLGIAPHFYKSDHTVSNCTERNTSSMTYRSNPNNNNHFSELPHSGLEVRDISNLFSSSGYDTTTIFGESATELKFKQTVPDFQFVHIATHGFSNDPNPELSGLAFSKPSLPSVIEISSDATFHHELDDGILYAGEMYNLDISADLMVLSACETGIGKLIKGEGMMAMTRGLIYSGAKNIIYTHWKISDKHTHQFMLNFYGAIIQGHDYAEALRLAKLEMLKEESTAYPKLWSGYMLIGE